MKKVKNHNHPVKGSSTKVDPIKDIRDINAIENLLAANPRNHALFVLGINTSLYIGELLTIKTGQVQDLRPGDVIKIRKNNKQNKATRLPINQKCVEAIGRLIRAKQKSTEKDLNSDDYLFTGLRGLLTIPSVNNLVKRWCAAINLKGNYGCHTLRKTYGYQQLVRCGASVDDLMVSFNQSSPLQTLDYLCLLPEILENIQQTGKGAFEKSYGKEHNNDIKTRQPEDAFGESEGLYKVIFENVNDEIIYTTTDGTIVDVNDRVEDIFGYKREEVIGHNITEAVNSFTKETIEKYIKLSHKAKHVPQNKAVFEFEAFHRDGTPIIIEGNSRLYKKSGKVLGAITIIKDITKRKRAEKELQKIRDDLEAIVEERTINLEEANTTLKILLKKRDEEKSEIEEKVWLNVKKLVTPYIEKLKKSRLDNRQQTVLDIVESNINEIVSPFVRKLSAKHLMLTPSEIQVANLIKQGKSSKEIATLLNMSSKTVDTHRYNIRKKIGLTKKKENLRTYMLSLK